MLGVTDMGYEILAEVSVGLTGFAGVIVAIRSRFAPLPRLQLIGFLQTILPTMLLSLFVPFLMTTFATNADITLRSICAVLAIYHCYISFGYDFKNRQLAGVPWYQLLILLLSIPVIIAKFTAALGLIPNYVETVLYLTLLWFIAIATYIFATYLLQATATDENRDGA